MSNKRYRTCVRTMTGGFTLVEVLISAVILSIVVFSILRLSGNNTAQIGVMEKNRLMNQTISDTRECLKSMDYDMLSALSSTVSINFGIDNNGCLTGAYDQDLSFTGITLRTYDNEGQLGGDEIYSYIKTRSGSDAINIDNYVTDGKNIKKSTYKIFR